MEFDLSNSVVKRNSSGKRTISMASISNFAHQLFGYGKLCLNVQNGWLKTWGGPPAYILSSVPVFNNIFLRSKEAQLNHLAKSGLRELLLALPEQQPTDGSFSADPVKLDDKFINSFQTSRFIAATLNVTMIWLTFKACPFPLAFVISGGLIALLIDASAKALSIRHLVLSSWASLKNPAHKVGVEDYELLVQSGVRIPDLESMHMHMSFGEDKAMAQFFVEHGAAVNRGFGHQHNRKPLHCIRNPETIAYLINAGADTEIRDRGGYTPLLLLQSEH